MSVARRGSAPDLRVGISRRDWVVLGGLLVLAAALRLPNLETRSTWGPEQAAIMVALRTMFTSGAVPLLGLPTGEGAFHHGALFYYLLAPSAAPAAGANPTTVVVEMAAAGIATVAATWWLARDMGGPVAGLVSGFLAAISAIAVTSSTVIDNPNLMPLFSAIAIGAAWRAWDRRQLLWWLVAAAGLSVVQQLHILGVLALPSFLALFALDVRRRPGGRRSLLLVGLAGAAILAAGYLPLLVHEITTGFAEIRAASGARPGAFEYDLLGNLAFIPLRIATFWLSLPDQIDGPVGPVVVVSTLVFAGAGAWSLARVGGRERAAAAWLAGLWAAGATLLAITFKVRGMYLPFFPDWYVMYLGPAVIGLIGLAAAVLWRKGSGWRVAAIVAVVTLATWNVAARQPPPIAYDGGWPAARAAGDHVAVLAAGSPVAFIDASRAPVDYYAYPFEVAGGRLADDDTTGWIAVSCFDAWRSATGVTAPCGGPAESEVLMTDLRGRELTLVERFSPAYGRHISVYRPTQR